MSAREGSEESFRALYRAVHPPLVRYLHTMVGQDAEDVASEAWLQIARDLPTFGGDFAGFKAWSTTIARNRALDHLRRIRRRPADTMPVEQLFDLASGENTESEAVAGVGTRNALRLLAELPRDQAEAILLRVVVGLDANAAGAVLGKRAGAVRTAAYRGLKRLAAILDERAVRPTVVRQSKRGVTSPATSALKEAR